MQLPPGSVIAKEKLGRGPISLGVALGFGLLQLALDLLGGRAVRGPVGDGWLS